METKNKNRKRGFIQIVIIVVGALVLLRYVYDIDIIGFLTQGRFKELLDQFYGLGAKGWAKYSEILLKVWNFFFDVIKNIVAKFR